MAPADPYPEIGKLLVASASGPWDRIELRAEVGSDWGTLEASSMVRGGTAQGMKVQGAARLLKLLQDLRRITTTEVAPGRPAWRTIVFTLRRDGDFDVEFGY